MSDGTEAREAAYRILRAVASGKPFDQARDREFQRLSESDRRLAHEIASGVLRGRSELDGRLSPLVQRRWGGVDGALRDLLRIGAYQLEKLDRIPRYAAVTTTVSVARRLLGEKHASFANAVLRRLADRPRSAAISTAGRSTTSSLSRRYSHPDWLVRRWVRNFGASATEALLSHNNSHPKLAIQPARWSRQELKEALEETGVSHRDDPFGSGFVITGCRVRDLPGYEEGSFVVQDPAQARMMSFAAIPSNSHLWDACGAPGGKTAVFARTCSVIASDLGKHRLDRLLETVRRAAPGVAVVAADARRPPFKECQFDAVLLDVPCTATGAMVRHPDARWRLSRRRLKSLVRLQSQLLSGAAQTVRQGGLLIYVTCSLEPEENSNQIDAFLKSSHLFHRASQDLNIFPADAATDGGYAAKLSRAE